MQHTLSDLLCYCSWRMVTLTGEPNKGKCSREVTAISFVMVHFTCFRHFWISNCVSCLKMLLLQFGFLCQLGPDPPPKKKVKPNEKNGKEIRMLYNKEQMLVLSGQFSECMAESVWLGNLWQGKPNLHAVYVCDFVKNRFSKSIPFRIFLRGWNTL